MVCGHDADEGLLEQFLGAQDGWCRHAVEDDVGQPSGEVLEDAVVPGPEGDGGVRRLLEDALEQGGAEHHRGVVGAGEAERLGRGSGVERLAGEQDLQPGQDRDQLTLDAFGARGQFVAGRAPDEEFVAQRLAQALQCSAHCGLGEVDPLSGARDVPLLQQCGQRHEEIQVHPIEMRHTHTLYPNDSLDA